MQYLPHRQKAGRRGTLFSPLCPGTVGTCDVVQQIVLGQQLYPRQGKVGGRAVRIPVWRTLERSTAYVVPTAEEKGGQFLGEGLSVNYPNYL